MTSAAHNKKCTRAFKIISDPNIGQRIRKCECATEFGFALLLRFVQLEALLKIIRYWEKANMGWPDRLDFLNANWKPLRDLKAENESEYEILIGSGGKSLIKMRNLIAHEGHSPCEKEYKSLAVTVDWANATLRSRLPPEHEIPKRVAHLKGRSVKEKKE